VAVPSRILAMACSRNFPAWWMPSDVPSKCNGEWLTAMRTQLKTSGSPFGLGSTSVTLSPNRTTFMAMGSTSAARLEALAEPGGICVSRVVRDQVRDRLDLAFEDLGEQRVKNIARPLRVYRIRVPAPVIVAPAPDAAIMGPLPLPDKPSVAVLPFTNMSGDPEQEFFSDGIAVDIITALSRYPSLFVIAATRPSPTKASRST